MGAFVISPLPPVLLEPLQTAGPLRFADITPFHRYYRPGDFPVSPVIRLPCSADFSPGLGGFLQLLSMTLSPSCLPTPAVVFRRIGPCDAPCCLRPKSEGSAFGLQYFRGHMGSLALRPGDSLTILFRWLSSIGFRIFSFLPSCYSS